MSESGEVPVSRKALKDARDAERYLRNVREAHGGFKDVVKIPSQDAVSPSPQSPEDKQS